MQQGISNPEFFGDLVYKFKKIIGNPNFSDLFKHIAKRFKRAGYILDILRQTACLVFNPIMVEGYAALFSCTAVVQASWKALNSWLKLYDWLWLNPLWFNLWFSLALARSVGI